jgi:hypothetical protein
MFKVLPQKCFCQEFKRAEIYKASKGKGQEAVLSKKGQFA